MMTISQEQHVTTWWASSDYLGHQAASRKCASFQAEEYQQRTLEKRKYNFSLKSLFDVKQKPKTRTDFFVTRHGFWLPCFSQLAPSLLSRLPPALVLDREFTPVLWFPVLKRLRQLPQIIVKVILHRSTICAIHHIWTAFSKFTQSWYKQNTLNSRTPKQHLSKHQVRQFFLRVNALSRGLNNLK